MEQKLSIDNYNGWANEVRNGKFLFKLHAQVFAEVFEISVVVSGIRQWRKSWGTWEEIKGKGSKISPNG